MDVSPGKNDDVSQDGSLQPRSLKDPLRPGLQCKIITGSSQSDSDASPGGERKCRKVEPSPTPRSSDMPHCEGDHPLIRLQGNQFLTLRDVAHAHSMLLQQCPSQIRLHILSKQLEIWSDDEVRWHLARIQS